MYKKQVILNYANYLFLNNKKLDRDNMTVDELLNVMNESCYRNEKYKYDF